MRVGPLGQEDTLEKGMTTHSSILAWKIPWTQSTVHGVAEPNRTEFLSTQRSQTSMLTR